MNHAEKPLPRIFSCTRCNHCCGGQPGFVWLSSNDLRSLCEYTQLTVEQFAKKFCRIVDIGIKTTLSLDEKENNDCIFLSQEGCRVYPVRPAQCRTYPFWESIVYDDDAWQEESLECPGIGKGSRIGSEAIIDAIIERRQNPPLSIDDFPELKSVIHELKRAQIS